MYKKYFKKYFIHFASKLPGNPTKNVKTLYIFRQQYRRKIYKLLNVRVCMRVTYGRRMKRWVDLNVCIRVCACVHVRATCLRACDLVCEDGMIDARSDG